MPAHTLVRTEWIGPSATQSLGWAAWLGTHAYALHDYVFPTAANVNGYYYKATSITTGISAVSEPAWPTGVGSTVVDGGVTWTRQYTTAVLGSELAALDAAIAGLVQGGGGAGTNFSWRASFAFGSISNASVEPTVPNGFYYLVTASTGDNKSGATEPAWPTVIGQSVVDHHVTWTCTGPTDAGGGGSWAPSSPIIIGGSGLGLDEGFGLVLCRGGSLTLANTVGIAFGAGDYWNYGPTHAGRTRVLQYSCALGLGFPIYAWRVRFGDGGMQSVAGLIDWSDGNGPQPVSLKVPLRSHNGATLSQVKVCWRIGVPHQQLPSVMPQFRVVRVDSGGNVVPLTSVAAGGDPNGYVFASSPASVAAWTGNQSQTLTCDQNNVIDLTQYTYYVEIIEEQTPGGLPFSLVMHPPVKAVFNMTNPASGIPSTIDTVAMSNGDRFLVVTADTPYAFMTGIYVYSTAVNGITRASDLDSASGFSLGAVVPVDLGSNCGGAYFQAHSPTGIWDPGTQPGYTVAWSANFDYANANPFYPSALVPTVPNGLWYANEQSYGDEDKVIQGGPTEPAWPTVVGQSVVDATVWSAGASVPAYAAGAPASVCYVPLNNALATPTCFVNFGGAGTTGGTEPIWPTTLGGTVVDNTVTWTYVGSPVLLTCMGPTSSPLSFSARPQLNDAIPSAPSGFYANGNIYDAVIATYSDIAGGAFQ